jgi:hypothetical protein
VGHIKPAGQRAPMWRVIVAMAVVVTMLGLGSDEAQAADAIELRYEDPPGSPWATIWDEDGDGADDTCDPDVAPADPYTMVYPAALGAFGVDHPVVVWGSGTSTGANPNCFYEPWLELLAQWGFVVVAANTGQAGTGNEIQFGAAAMVSLNGNSSSIFYQNIDTDHIAAAGHSQGAIGAINATLNAPDSLFASVLAMSTPDRSDMQIYNDPNCTVPVFCCALLFGAECVPVPMPSQNAMSTLAAPIFFARGSTDLLTDQTHADWYPDPSPAVPYAAATRQGASHTDMSTAFGYMNAWLVYTLDLTTANPATARAAFVGSPAEISTNTTKWQGVTLANLP